MISMVGVSVGMGDAVGSRVSVGGMVGVMGMYRSMLSVTRFSTSALSPIKVRRSEIIPFGSLDRSHEYRVSFFTGLSLSFKTVHDAGSAPRPYSSTHFLNPSSAVAEPLISRIGSVMTSPSVKFDFEDRAEDHRHCIRAQAHNKACAASRDLQAMHDHLQFQTIHAPIYR